MKKNSFFQILLIIIFVISSCTQSQVLKEASPAAVKVSAERLGRIDRMLQQAIDSTWIMGAVGFVARDGKVIYNKPFGINDSASRTPMKTDVIFRIASQSKAITSVAVMILFEEGKLLLDDPISKYIPEFAQACVLDKYNEKDTTFTTVPAKREITIRDLLTHTSGIEYAVVGSPTMTAIYGKAGIPVGFECRPMLLAGAIKKLAKLPLVHQPGERFTYGLSTDVLGYLVEVISGMNLDQFLKEKIFLPLGMKDTYFYVPKEKQSRIATVYTENKMRHLEKWRDQSFPGIDVSYPLVNGTYFSGGAGLSSTINDYAIFLQMLLNGGVYNGKRILARRTVELMTMNQIGELMCRGDGKFGLGFEITTKAGEAKLGVTEGSFFWGGHFETFYWVDPKERLVCLCFMQQSPQSHGDIREKFRVLVYQALDN
jgi:CubicO group peptidase (beta-lactamase class C family)